MEGHLCHILAVSVVKGGQRALQGTARGTSGREVGRGVLSDADEASYSATSGEAFLSVGAEGAFRGSAAAGTGPCHVEFF